VTVTVDIGLAMAAPARADGAADGGAADERLMALAIECAERCEPSPAAYCVGAVLVCVGGAHFTGFSRERPGNVHAEEVALAKAAEAGVDAAGGCVATTMEPCSLRLSGARPCADRLIEARVARVVIGIAEPSLFVARCEGAVRLAAAGIDVAHCASAGLRERALAAAMRGHAAATPAAATAAPMGEGAATGTRTTAAVPPRG